jgi:hypothetical protein
LSVTAAMSPSNWPRSPCRRCCSRDPGTELGIPAATRSSAGVRRSVVMRWSGNHERGGLYHSQFGIFLAGFRACRIIKRGAHGGGCSALPARPNGANLRLECRFIRRMLDYSIWT